MELKPYQKQIIQDLQEYLSALVEEKHLRQAFARFWKSQKDILPPESYKDTVSGVPHVCVKVPTGGGKTSQIQIPWARALGVYDGFPRQR